jgi:peptidyl-Lys metalloendopeptidase
MTDRKSALTVTLSLRVKKSEPVLARMQFFNSTDQPYQLLSWLTFPTGHIDSKSYLSVQIDGQNARYIGILKKRAAPTAADYISVRPGETVTSIVSLSEAYAIGNSGILTVTYSAINPSLTDDEQGDHLNSNTVSARLD